MKIDELTIGEARNLANMFQTKTCDQPHPYKIGQAYLIRTVTHYYTGRLVWVGKQELKIEEVAWIADTGRFSDAIVSGELDEIEPMHGAVIIGRGAIIDAQEWPHPLPKDKK